MPSTLVTPSWSGAEVAGRLSLVTAPDSDPVSVAEAKRQVRRELSFTDDDKYLKGLIAAARDTVESDTGRQLLTATYQLRLDTWPCEAIDLPKPPLVSVSSITYLDTAGATQTLATSVYVVSAPTGPTADRGRIALAYGQAWPTLRGQMNAITVAFTAGYGDATAVPPALKAAMLLLIGHWYQHRESVVTGMSSKEIELAYTALVKRFRTYPIRMGYGGWRGTTR